MILHCLAAGCGLLFAGVLLAGSVATAQVAQGPGGYADTVFEQLNTKNGLPGSAAQAFTQDANGFVWVGTETGLSRWDGYHFRSYLLHAGDAGSLPSNNVISLYTDPQKRLWVGTNRGIARYDAALDRFQTFTPAGSGGAYPSIYQMVTDGGQGLWLATRRGLDHFDPATGSFAHELMEGVATGPNVQAVVRDTDGHVWAGGTKGLFRSDASGHNFKAVPVTEGKAPTVWSLLRDSAGRLWIGTTAGAYVMEAGAALPRKIAETGVAAGAASPLDTQGVDALIEPEPGVVWLGTYGEGMVEVDTRTWQTHRLVHQPPVPTSLAHNLVDALFRDRSGAVWVGTLAGLSRKDPAWSAFRVFLGGTGDAAHPIADHDVTATLQTKDGRIWIGLLEKGVQVFDAASGKLLNDPSLRPKAEAALKMQQVTSFLDGPDGRMYFGSQQGLFRADHDGRHVEPAPLKGQKAIYMLLYEAGKLWMATTDGLWTVPFPLPAHADLGKALLAGPVNGLVRGSDGAIWAGTTTALYRVDAATGAIERSAISTSKPGAIPAPITSLMTDHAGRLWISTDGAGLYQLQSRDAKGEMSFRKVLDTNAGQLLEAADGSLWFPTDHTVERLNPATLAHEAFTVADGLSIDSFWLNGGSVTPDGKFLLAGAGGLVVIDPRAPPQAAQPVTVNVTDFIVGEKPNAGAQSVANSGKGVIEVRPNANTFSVEFAALDYAAPAMSQYAYRMKGVDRDWVMTDADHRIARYTNLSPGRYALEIKATNHKGAWGPARSIAIRVYPAWYQTAWARLLALVAGVALLFWLVRLYTAILRAQQRQLERQVTLRTAELRATTVELQRSQQELERIAYSDSLTGLSNRRMFADCFKKLMAQKQGEGGSFTLLQIDLDKFKSINDGYGHDVGDVLLCEVAQRLVRSVEDTYCLARIGGDEFAILLDKVADGDEIDRVCAAIKQSLAEPLLIQGFEFRNTASVGVAVYPQDGSDQASLFKAADVALYAVKREGRNGWRRHNRDQATPTENAAAK